MPDAAHEAGALAHAPQVRHRHTHVFCRDVGAAKRLHEVTKRIELGRRGWTIGEDNGFAAAERDTRQSVLVGHALGQAQHVTERGKPIGVVPAAQPASRWTQRRVVDRNDCSQARRTVLVPEHPFVSCERGVIEHLKLPRDGAQPSCQTAHGNASRAKSPCIPGRISKRYESIILQIYRKRMIHASRAA